jgi:hypothetical protein
MSLRHSIIAVSALVFVGAPALASMEPVSKMYDLRDLAALLPPAAPSPQARASTDPLTSVSVRKVPILGDLPLLSPMFIVKEADQPAAPQTEIILPSVSPVPNAGPDDAPTDLLVGKLCNLLSLQSEELVENVYFIEGEEANQAKFSEAIERVRALYLDRVQIEVSCYEVDAASAPNIGDAAPKSDKPAISAKAVAIRKTLTPVQATRTVSYVSRWTPIVGDSAVGLEPGTSTVTDGLALGIRVTGEGDSARVGIQGAITKAEIASVQVPADQAMAGANVALSPGGPLVTIGLPRIDRRSIATDVTIKMNQPTVVACVPGFKEGKQVVVAVKVKAVE